MGKGRCPSALHVSHETGVLSTAAQGSLHDSGLYPSTLPQFPCVHTEGWVSLRVLPTLSD